MTAYRIDNLGSFLRPPELLQAREQHKQGSLTDEELRAVEDDAILRLLDQEKRARLEVFTDGEFRRTIFTGVLTDAVDGFVLMPLKREWRGTEDTVSEDQAPVAAAKLRPKRRLAAHEAQFMAEHSPGPFKITLPSPNQFPEPGYRAGVTDAVYPTRQDLLRDLAAIVRDEVEALVQDGVRYVQLDAPRYSYYLDEGWRARLQAEGVDLQQALTEAVAADNLALQAAKKPGVTRGIHLCRGNARSRWYAEGSYEPVAETLFGGLDADVFLLEYDSDRAGGFEPLRFLPRGKTAVLGLVTTKQPELESQDDLLRRIDEAAGYMPLENLALSTQCGFASGIAGNAIGYEDQWRKLELVADTARKVWG